MVCTEVPGYGIAVFFAKRTVIRRICHIFTAKGATIQALQDGAHCGTAIKVQHLWWEKSGTNAAMFSSATVVRLLPSF